jgi:hypothetical protein
VQLKLFSDCRKSPAALSTRVSKSVIFAPLLINRA